LLTFDAEQRGHVVGVQRVQVVVHTGGVAERLLAGGTRGLRLQLAQPALLAALEQLIEAAEAHRARRDVQVVQLTAA
jgi:hypothetical protein